MREKVVGACVRQGPQGGWKGDDRLCGDVKVGVATKREARGKVKRVREAGRIRDNL